MSKPVIAIDIDQVLFPLAETFLEYHNEKFGTNLKIEQMKSYYVEELTGDTWEEFLPKLIEHTKSKHYLEGLPLEQAIEAITKLKTKYHLEIITSRDDFYRGSTEEWLTKHFPELFRAVHFTHTEEEPNIRVPKYEICKRVGATVLIEDMLQNAIPAAEAGISVLLFGNYPWNQAKQLPDNVTRVKDWEEVLNKLL